MNLRNYLSHEKKCRARNTIWWFEHIECYQKRKTKMGCLCLDESKSAAKYSDSTNDRHMPQIGEI